VDTAEQPNLREVMAGMGLLPAGVPARFTALTGGVSSDIVLVEAGDHRFCVKRALARLKVADDWRVPTGRNAAEAAWIRTVARWQPDAVPALLGEAPEAGLFAMAYLPPEDHPVWKAELAAGRSDPDFAASVGSRLAAIHAASAADPSVPARFANEAIFEAIRIGPYLRTAAERNPDLAGALNSIAEATLATKRALVHGDVSPKNILCGPRGPVFLDAECAWFGDPAFDLAFCLNHLLLKGAWFPERRAAYLTLFAALRRAYLAGVAWEPPAELECRTARLLPALLLARVDGKSPVEYLPRESERAPVRRFARRFLQSPTDTLDAIAEAWIAAQ